MYRFNDFTFDPRSGDLTGPRGTTRLQPQAAAVLTMLAERAGSVMRTELQQHLWPDTTVGFDDGLNTCVRQLRVALGDEANAPQFIETLPRRGYRLMPEVSWADSTAPSDLTARPLADSPFEQRPGRRFSRNRLSLVVVAVVVLAVALSALRRHPNALTTPAASLAIMPFTVDTTDALMVKYQQGLMTQMLQSAKAEGAWRLVAKSGATHVLSGSLKRDGNTVSIFAELVLAGDRRHLWAEDIVDTYPFAGNSKIMGDRIEKNAARVLTSPR